MSEPTKYIDPIEELSDEIGHECKRVKVGTPESTTLVVAQALLVVAKELRALNDTMERIDRKTPML